MAVEQHRGRAARRNVATHLIHRGKYGPCVIVIRIHRKPDWTHAHEESIPLGFYGLSPWVGVAQFVQKELRNHVEVEIYVHVGSPGKRTKYPIITLCIDVNSLA